MARKILKIAYIVIALGLFLIIFAAYIDLQFPKEKYDFGVLGNIIIRSLFKDLGVGLIISGFVNLIIEKGGFSEDYAKRVANVMTKDEYIDCLNENKMLEMLYKLQARIVFNGKIEDKNNYFYVVQNEMMSLLDRYYYDECYVRIECFIEGNIIRKVMNKRMVIINPKIGNRKRKYVGIPFYTDMISIPGMDDKELFKINYFKVDSDEFTRAARSKLRNIRIEDKNLEGYNVRFSGTYEIECRNSCVVEMQTESMVPLTDNIFSNRLSQPCRSYDIILHLHSCDYRIDGVSFCLMENHVNKVVDYKCEQSIEVRFTDWMLPGNGVVFVISPKNNG